MNQLGELILKSSAEQKTKYLNIRNVNVIIIIVLLFLITKP